MRLPLLCEFAGELPGRLTGLFGGACASGREPEVAVQGRGRRRWFVPGLAHVLVSKCVDF